MQVDILTSGSSGNATIINGEILIDCGMSYSALEEYKDSLKLVLLTHAHSDHFRESTIQKLAKERPTVRFATPTYLVAKLVQCGVRKSNIDVLEYEKWTRYTESLAVKMFDLPHGSYAKNVQKNIAVENVGYKLEIGKNKIIYATDTSSMDGVKAKGYDLYLIEANYSERELAERVAEATRNGEFTHEKYSRLNHLSKEKCDAWLAKNMGENGQIVYMHKSKYAKY